MKQATLACLLVSIAALACGQPAPEADDQASTGGEAQPVKTGDQEKAELLFVPESQGVVAEGETLTMTGLEAHILFFTDRPERLAGYLGIDEFLSAVSEGPASFSEEPPHATLSSLAGDDFPDVVVELKQRPRYEDDNLVFKVDVVEGELPPTGGPSALFIDTRGRPLSPESVAAAHRRHRPRASEEDTL